ncbi:hypothetical protein BH11PLA2_BH11PLA2_26330 [soil metagenome]
MPIWITFAVLALGAAIALFAITAIVQSYLYEQAAARLPLRALAGGIIAGLFLTYWVHLNTRADFKDKFGTLFEFNSTAMKPLDEFNVIRRYMTKDAEGKYREVTRPMSKIGSNYVEGKDPTKPFKLATADYITVALEVPDGDTKARFDAELFVPDESKPGEVRLVKPGETPADPKYSRETVRFFREVNGRRYIEFNQLGTPGSIQAPSRGAFIGALLLNFGHFVVWILIFWLVLRFSFGAAIGLGVGFGALTMLFVMPILFDRNRPGAAPAAVVAVAQL